MSEIRYFTVVETREVKVSANTVTDAVRIANKAFETNETRPGLRSKEGLDGIWGDIRTGVRQTALEATEGR